MTSDSPIDAHEFDGIVDNAVPGWPLGMKLLFAGLILWAIVYAAIFLLGDWSSAAEFESAMAEFRQAATP